MQHKGNSEGRWGALERPQAAFWGLSQATLLTPPSLTKPPPGARTLDPTPGRDPPHSWDHPYQAFLIGHGIHEGLFLALGGEEEQG